MRKADYAALAAIIQEELRYARSMAQAALTAPRKALADGMVHAYTKTAQRFSKAASVNPVEFLRACGIDPG